jgi:hypothetical protein
LLSATPALADDVAVTTEIPPGKSRSIRLRALPAGALLAVRVVTSGRVLVALVGMKQLKDPTPQSKPLFRASVRDKLSFRVTIREADDYLLVLNNRAGKEALSVDTQISAVRARRKPAPKDYFEATSASRSFSLPGSTGLVRW